MSGECKSYKLNEPMTWVEFKMMPDDIKITYIKLLREKFNPSDSEIAKMMLVSVAPFSKEMHRLGINIGEKRSGKMKWDRDGFVAWVNGIRMAQNEQIPAVEEPAEEAVEVPEIPEIPEIPEVKLPPIEIPEVESKPCVPINGTVTFEGRTEDILKTVGMMLKGANVLLSIKWDVIDNG